MNTNKNITAIQIFADFFKFPVTDIRCSELFGGSEPCAIFKCSYQNQDYVIKLFTNEESGKNESAFTALASSLKIGVALFYADPAGTYMITEFAKGSSLLPDMVNSSAIIKKIALNLSKLHNSTAPFARETDLGQRISSKYTKLQSSGPLHLMLQRKWNLAQEIIKLLDTTAMKLAPCHNDLNWGNIFSDSDGVKFIDWGDAALANPYFDIAAFFVLNMVTSENEKLFFLYYDKSMITPEWQLAIQKLKQLVYFEFALNLLLGVQAGKKELLHLEAIPSVNHLSYYLTLLSKRETTITSNFLYNTAITSLNEMKLDFAYS